MKTLHTFLATSGFFLSLSLVYGTPSVDAGLDQGPDPELRLRLSDDLQEKRTTSLNWVDLRAARFLSPVVEATPIEPEDTRLKVLIDPGHGGDDLGAVTFGGVKEKDIALRISRMVRQEILSQSRRAGAGVKVRLTRDDDTFIPLKERPEIANNWDADLFVSIHLNSSPSTKVRGFEVYFLNPRGSDAEASRVARVENGGEKTLAKTDIMSIISDAQTSVHIAESSSFAETLYAHLSSEVLPNKRGVRQAPFAVLAGTTMPALLIEVGYLTHQGETENLKRGLYLKRVASAISSGILRFAQSRKKLDKPEAPNAIRRQAAR